MQTQRQVFIQGKRIYLTPVTKDLLSGHYLNWFNDADVTQHMIKGTYPTTLHDLTVYYEQVILTHKALVLAIFDQETHTHIGNVSLQNMNALHRNAEMGICIGEKAFWNKGYGKDAVALICHHGFQQLNIHRIELGVLATHIGGIKSYEKVGFVQEGRFRQAIFKNGQYVDVVRMSLFASEQNETILKEAQR